MTPLVSILITAYNREKFIAEAIGSVLNSSMTDFEVIIVDDASTDGTYAICTDFLSRDRRIKLFRNESNLGQFGNRNRAAELASGKYLKYLDSDDIIYKYGLAQMVESMEKFPSAAFGVFSNNTQDDKTYPYELTPLDSFRQFYFNRDVLIMGPSATIFRRDKFLEVEGFTDFSVLGDTEMLCKMAFRFTAVKVGASQIWWRPHPDQEYRLREKDYVTLIYLMNKRILTDPRCPLTDGEKKILLGNNRRLMGRRILDLSFRKGHFSDGLRLLRTTGIGSATLLESLIPVNRIKNAGKKLTGR